jgi:Cd2+/Zn2+-exporting ATPase
MPIRKKIPVGSKYRETLDLKSTAQKIVLKVEGMDCLEEVSALKKELASLVGGEEALSFDILNRTLTVSNTVASLPAETLIERIASIGMKATLWEDTSEDREGHSPGHSIRRLLTLGGTLALVFGLLLHAYLHGSVTDALFGGEGIESHQFPLSTILLYCLSILLSGWLIFPKAWRSARSLRPDMNLLMMLAVIGAMFIGEWLEAAMVTFLFSLSLLLESWSVERARKATKSLLDLAPTMVRILTAVGQEQMIPANEAKVGSHFMVKPGERIPLDGVLVKGSSEVNQAPITGESVPVAKQAGDSVFAGTINGSGALEVRCTKISSDTTLAHIIRLVRESYSKRASSEQWVEKFAKVYTPAILILALAVCIIPPLAFSKLWSEWIYRSLVLLVIACPCALVISTPVSIVAALTAAAKNGILIKGGKYIEIPATLRAIAFDKTGTLTKGELTVSLVIPFNDHSEGELLELASAIESRSEHPIAKAIVNYAKQRKIHVLPAEDYQAVQGKGATASIQGVRYWLGSHRYLEEMAEETPALHEQLESLSGQGFTVLTLGNEEHICGVISLSDTLRENASSMIQDLHAMGIKHLIMLSGDNKGTADLIGGKVGMDEVSAELLPVDKVSKIEELVTKYKTVAMVGDGVNDAPAMARASFGIAMGVAGSDAAIESADIALMADDLSKIPWLIRHSKKTLGIIRQNIGFSLFVKGVFVVLTFTGHASLWAAIAADTGASLLVIFNGLRLLKHH